jgi:hypothetical protein
VLAATIKYTHNEQSNSLNSCIFARRSDPRSRRRGLLSHRSFRSAADRSKDRSGRDPTDDCERHFVRNRRRPSRNPTDKDDFQPFHDRFFKESNDALLRWGWKVLAQLRRIGRRRWSRIWRRRRRRRRIGNSMCKRDFLGHGYIFRIGRRR